MEKLNLEELMHVSNLAKLELNESEQEKFSTDLAMILNDIEKINKVDINEYHNVTELEFIGKEEALKNSKLSDGDYIVVPQVISD